MKRFITLLALTIIVLLANPTKAAAQPPLITGDLSALFNLKVREQQPAQIFIVERPAPEPEKERAKPKKQKPKVYKVVAGDNLTKIGTKYNVEWQRLWAKNKQLKHPDVIHIGDKITIPEPSERLKRALPAVVSLPKETPNVQPLRSYDAGNTYDYGYCTWYVKNRRGASLPNGLGNANTWYARAAAAGMAVGSTPKPGAVGTTTRGELGHVVYVESVNSDGTITISEMNYKGWGVQSSRTASASEFVYIY